MKSAGSNLVDYATLAMAALGPIAAFLTARWAANREKTSQFDAHIGWKDYGPNAYINEAPMLYLHNKGKHAILVTDIDYCVGVFRTQQCPYTAVYYEDPQDIDFPYEIAAGKHRAIMLDGAQLIGLHARQTQKSSLERRLRRSSVWLHILTGDGVGKTISAITVLPSHLLPMWAGGDNDRT